MRKRVRTRFPAEEEQHDASRRDEHRWTGHRLLSGMHFKIKHDRVPPTVRLDRKASGRARRERHCLRPAGVHRRLDVVAVQMKYRAAIGRPVDLHDIVASDADGSDIAGEATVFNPQIEALQALCVALSDRRPGPGAPANARQVAVINPEIRLLGLPRAIIALKSDLRMVASNI